MSQPTITTLGTFTLRQMPDGRRNIFAMRGDNKESIVIPFSGTPSVDAAKLAGTMARYATELVPPAPKPRAPSLPKPKAAPAAPPLPKPRPPQLRGPGTPLYAPDAPKATGVSVTKLRTSEGPLEAGAAIKGRPNLPGVEEIRNDPQVDQLQGAINMINDKLAGRPTTAPVAPPKVGMKSGRPVRDAMRVTDIAKRAGTTSSAFAAKAAEMGVLTDSGAVVTHPNQIIRPADADRVLTAMGLKTS